MRAILKFKGPGRGWWGPPKGTHTAQAAPGGEEKTLAESMQNPWAVRNGVGYADKHIGIQMERTGLTKEEIERHCNTAMEGAAEFPVVIQAPLMYADTILEDGFKNQHELGHSRGTFNPSIRKEAELEAFAIDESKAALSDYPIYGYLDVPNSYVGAYGDVTFVLKEDIKSRTTMTAGDSLYSFRNGLVAGTPVTKPGKEGWDGYVDEMVAGKGRPSKAVGQMGYFEAQIHGGIKASDIASIELRRDVFSRDWANRNMLSDLKRAAAASGIKVYEVYK